MLLIFINLTLTKLESSRTRRFCGTVTLEKAKRAGERRKTRRRVASSAKNNARVRTKRK